MIEQVKNLIARYEEDLVCYKKWLEEEKDNMFRRLELRSSIEIREYQIETAKACIEIIEKGE